MLLRSRLSQAARELVPLQQGDLDSLCGLYAVINAVRIALYPERSLNSRELTRLFDRGLASLSKTRRLRAFTTEGMHLPVWNTLCDAVLAEATRVTGVPILRRRLAPEKAGENSQGDAIRRIKRSLRRGRPVLVALMGTYDHYTVIASFSATRLNLFDSRQRKWVLIRSISFDPTAAEVAHYVPPGSVVALSAGPATDEP